MAFALQIRQNLGCKIFALLRPLIARPSAPMHRGYALPLPSWARIVLPDFGRSCSTDGVEYFYKVGFGVESYAGKGLCARPFDGLRVTGPLIIIFKRVLSW